MKALESYHQTLQRHTKLESGLAVENQPQKESLDKFITAIGWISIQTGWIAGGLAFVMMLAIIREVIGRYFFNAPTAWSVDLNAFLLIGMVYLGSAYTTFFDGHVRADFFYIRITGRSKAWLDIFIDIICIYYCSMLVWEGWLLAYESLVYSEVSSGGVRWPLFPFQVLVPLGSALVILCLCIRIMANIRFLAGRGEPFSTSRGGH